MITGVADRRSGSGRSVSRLIPQAMFSSPTATSPSFARSTPPEHTWRRSPADENARFIGDGLPAHYSGSTYRLASRSTHPATSSSPTRQQPRPGDDGIDGVISTVAGNGATSCGGDSGPATDAELDDPDRRRGGLRRGPLHRRQPEQRIREVNTATGMITTVAGNGTSGLQRRWRTGHRRRAERPHGRRRGLRRRHLHRRLEQQRDSRGERRHRHDHHRRRQRRISCLHYGNGGPCHRLDAREP